MAAYFILAIFAVPMVTPQQPDSALTTVERFVKHVQAQDHIPEDARRFVQQQWQKRAGEKALRDFIPEMLALVHPRFREGLDAFQGSQFEHCAKIMGELSLNKDLFLASHAAYFQAKALLQDTHWEFAELLVSYYLRADEEFKLDQYSVLIDEMKFLRGFCQSQLLDYKNARANLLNFLEEHPDAAPDLRFAAKEILEALQKPPRKNLGQVAAFMSAAGEQLTAGQAGLETQSQQKKALIILEEMMQQAQSIEQQLQQQRQAQAGAGAQPSGSPMQPAATSTTLGGGAGSRSLHQVPANPGEVWGKMRPQQREHIMQMLQQKFPSRYRELIEQYYEQLAKEK